MSARAADGHLIGVDVGTTRVKAVAFDLAGALVTTSERPTPWIREGDGTAMDPAAIGELVRTVVAEAAAGLERVVGVGVTGMGEAGVLIDGQGRPLGPARAWHDQRADVDVVREALGENAFHAAVGMQLDAQPSLAKILRMRRDYPQTTQAVRFDSVPEWAVRCLGGRPGSELSLASRTGLLDVVTGRAWAGAVDLLGVDLLGEPQVAGTGQGTVSGSDLPAALRGAALAVGGHDHQCAAFVAGAARDGTFFDSLGTAEALLQFTRGPVDAALVERLAAGPGTMTMGLTVVAGHYCVMAGLRTGMKLELVAAALGATDRARRAELADAARTVLTTLDDGPEGAAAALAEAAAELLPEGVRITVRPGVDPARVWAATVLACVEQSRPALSRISEVVARPTRFVAAGGWTHDACLWHAKSAQLPGVVRTAVPEAGAAGAAYFAAVAAGVLPDATELTGAPWAQDPPTATVAPVGPATDPEFGITRAPIREVSS